MTCWARLGAVLVAMLAMMVLTALPAQAEPVGRIVEISSSPDSLRVLFVGNDLPPAAVIDLASVTVTLDGVDLPATARRITTQERPVRRTAMVLLDNSGSMTPTKLAAAKGAANAFLAALPDGVAVGLVTFSTQARLAVAPTTDLARVRSAVDAVRAGGDTALYDAVVLAVRALPADGVRNMVLLSDGQDDGSRTTLSKAAASVRGSKANLTAISIGTARTQVAGLRTLADAGAGALVATDRVDELAAAFRQAANDIDQQLVVDVPVPPGVSSSSGNLTVTATAGTADLSSTAFVSLAAPPTATAAPSQQSLPVVPQRAALNDGILFVALGAFFLALAVVLAFALGAATRSARPQEQMRRRLEIYTLSSQRPQATSTATKTLRGADAVARSALGLANRVVARQGFEAALRRKLEAAAIPLKSSEWVLIQVAVAIGMALAMFALSGGTVLAALFGMAVGAAAPQAYLTVRKSRRERAFLGALPDTLQLLAGSLQAGYSLPQALSAVAREGQEPVITEFNRALVEARLGVPLDDALEAIATRLESKDFLWVVIAVRIQREVGGNLAEVLTTVAATLRERERLRRQVQTLSAEGRLSAWILGSLPPLFTIYLIFVRPEYLRVLYTDPAGIVFILAGVLLLAAGAFWMSKVVKVEV